MTHTALRILCGLMLALTACGPVAVPSPTAGPPSATAAPTLTPLPTSTPRPTATPAPTLSAQAAWLQTYAAPLRSIQPDDTDFSDLAPLKAAIGTARIVLLGEQSHGDGATFSAKVRLIKFLHEEMGFNVLAFESGLYDCGQAWEKIQSGEPAASAFSRAGFPIYTQSAQVRPALEYVQSTLSTTTPLNLAGVDIQFTGSAAQNNFVKDLEKFLNRIKLDWPQRAEWPFLTSIFERVLFYDYQNGTAQANAAEQEKFFALMEQLQAEIAQTAPEEEARAALYWQQVLTSVAANLQSTWSINWETRTRKPGTERSLRDRLMAENALWLSNEFYPDSKIIIWAATTHLIYNAEAIELQGYPKAFDEFNSMGGFLREALGEEVYALGFVAYEGEFGKAGDTPEKIPTPALTDLEAQFYAAGREFSFLNFRTLPAGGEWLNEPVQSNSMLGYTPARAVWPQTLDGVIYIQTMMPSTKP